MLHSKGNLLNMLEPQVYKQVFEKCFRIPEYGTTRIVPLKPNPMQLELIDNMDYFNVILKARKEGFSTIILAIAMVNCNEIPNYNAVFLAHTDPDTHNIFSRVHTMIRNMEGLNLDVEQTKEGIYFKRTNARMQIATAGSRDAFRGHDIHLGHLSEIASYRYPDIYTAVLEAGARGLVMFFESTAKGRNLFYNLWKKAQKYPKESNFKPFFFGWDRHPKYQINVSDKFLLSKEEKEYQLMAKDTHDITLSTEQMAWRRDKLSSMPDPELFPQEFPLYAEEAFLSSGNPVFSTKQLAVMERTRADFRLGSIDLTKSKELSFYDDKSGYWEIYEPPKDGVDYIFGGDMAEGLAEGDFSAGFMFRPDTRVQVAQFHGHMDPDQAAYEINKGGKFYNTALAAIESDKYGYAVNTRLYTEYNYERLYMTEKPEDTLMVDQTLNYGFRTNTKTRPLMVDLAKRYIRKGLIKINSQRTIDECMSFITNAAGKPMHDVGGHDDCVFAMMIALYVAERFDEIAPGLGMQAKKDYYEVIGKKKYEEGEVGRAGY